MWERGLSIHKYQCTVADGLPPNSGVVADRGCIPSFPADLPAPPFGIVTSPHGTQWTGPDRPDDPLSRRQRSGSEEPGKEVRSLQIVGI